MKRLVEWRGACPRCVSPVCAPVFLMGGYLLANVPGVQENLHLLMLCLIVLTLLPACVPAIKARCGAQGRARQVLP